MTGWADLDRELDRWRASGAVADFWWRDDDAVEDTPRLRRLGSLAAAAGAPLALSVAPLPARPSLGARLAALPDVQVLQHGYAHRNHAAPGARKIELGGARDLAAAAGELIDGRRRLRALAGDAALPVLAPPWNRIDDRLLPALPALGYRGVSTFRPRAVPAAFPIRQVNAHVDIVDWRGSRGFCGEHAALSALVGHLAARRLGAADRGEPTGILTHHLVHDEAGWAFLEALAARLAGREGVRWLSAAEAFGIAR